MFLSYVQKNIYFIYFSQTNCIFLSCRNRIVKLPHDTICVSLEKVLRYRCNSLNCFTSNEYVVFSSDQMKTASILMLTSVDAIL